MITDTDVFPRFSYMNDAGHFGGWVNDYRDIDGTAEVVITRLIPACAGLYLTDVNEATRPIAEGEDYRDIIRAYADEVEADVYEREGYPEE
jgi:hypothetical protein